MQCALAHQRRAAKVEPLEAAQLRQAADALVTHLCTRGGSLWRVGLQPPARGVAASGAWGCSVWRVGLQVSSPTCSQPERLSSVTPLRLPSTWEIWGDVGRCGEMHLPLRIVWKATWGDVGRCGEVWGRCISP